MVAERRQRIWGMLVKGMKSYEIAKELKVNPSTISRDIQYLTSQSQIPRRSGQGKPTFYVQNFN
jgi:DeoR/GlpR family transcriptional regulator of sugar metabolism